MDKNASAYVALHEHMQHLRDVVDINEDVAKDVSKRFEKRIAANIASQRDPYGHLWQPSKLGQVLVDAMKSIAFKVSGTTIEIVVSGVEALHHIGAARGYRGGSAKLGGFRRALIPFSKLPGPFKDDILDALQKRWNEIFGARRAA
jgi:hypothetical protein